MFINFTVFWKVSLLSSCRISYSVDHSSVTDLFALEFLLSFPLPLNLWIEVHNVSIASECTIMLYRCNLMDLLYIAMSCLVENYYVKIFVSATGYPMYMFISIYLDFRRNM